MRKVYLKPKKCNLCGGYVIYTSNKIIYGKEYGNGKMYYCTKCHAYVGTHKHEPWKAMGILSNYRMRELRTECHEIFDKLWKDAENPIKERREKYKWLAGEMGIPLEECHFGWFSEEELEKALSILRRGNI